LSRTLARVLHFVIATGVALVVVVLATSFAPAGEPPLIPGPDGPGTAVIVGGLVLTLILPGYAITRVLSRTRVLNRIEQLFCVPVLSMATIVLGGLVSDVTGFTLTRPTWTYLLAGVAEVALVIDVALPRREPAADGDAEDGTAGAPGTAGADADTRLAGPRRDGAGEPVPERRRAVPLRPGSRLGAVTARIPAQRRPPADSYLPDETGPGGTPGRGGGAGPATPRRGHVVPSPRVPIEDDLPLDLPSDRDREPALVRGAKADGSGAGSAAREPAPLVLDLDEEPLPPRERKALRSRLATGAALAAVVAVAIATMVVGDHDAVAHQPASATVLAMEPAFAAEKPSRTVTYALYVFNGESRKTTFTIKLTGTGGYKSTMHVTVFPASAWSGRAKIPASGKVTAQLFRPGDTTPFRTVFEDPQDKP